KIVCSGDLVEESSAFHGQLRRGEVIGISEIALKFEVRVKEVSTPDAPDTVVSNSPNISVVGPVEAPIGADFIFLREQRRRAERNEQHAQEQHFLPVLLHTSSSFLDKTRASEQIE